MAYSDDIIALGPDHLWTFNNTSNDGVGSLNGTASGTSFSTSPIAEDSTHSLLSNATGDRWAVATSTDVDGSLTRKAVCGWIEVSAIQLPPKSIYREGTTTNQYNIVMWGGNNIMLDIVNSTTVVQAFADQVCEPGRSYHLFTRVEGTGFGNKVELYIDGLKQTITEPTNGQLGAANLAARTAAEWADPSSTTEVGNETVLLNGPVNCLYSHWATFSNANAQLTDNEIREELFEKGAIPGTTITSDTEVNMQTSLNAINNSTRPDEPLNIRVEAVTGDGNLELTATNITHDEKASIHVQYMGTGTLTWINGGTSDASISSTPNGGTINFQTTVDATVTVLDAADSTPIANARVLLETDSGGPTPAGTEIISGLSNVSGVATASVGYIGDQPITGKVRKASPGNTRYKPGSVGGSITSTGLDTTIFLVRDE